MNKNGTQPFLKWVGGKRWLLNTIRWLIPKEIQIYHEPFLGGGAIFFGLSFKKSYLSDINLELINTYTQVRNNVEFLIKKLKRKKINRKEFYQIRCKKFNDSIDQAVRFIYLNRTGFNGIYRVNKNGDFNVPFGCKPNTKLCETEALRKASIKLKKAKLRYEDFEEALDRVKSKDLVYIDPPYTVKHNNNGFVRYNESIFSWGDQLRLAWAIEKTLKRDAFVIISNALHNEIINIYEDFYLLKLTRPSNISARIDKRETVNEGVFLSKSLVSKIYY